MNLNPVFLNEMKSLLGDEYDDFINSLSQPEQKGLFVNQNKISVEDFCNCVDFSIEKIPYDEAGFYIDNQKYGRHPLHHAGAFYIQDPSAMFTVNAHNFRGDELVLDMCASPGGKSIQIANRIPNGVLVSNEIVKSRSDILASNIERMGLKNVIVANDSPERIAKAYANTFDVCLVDAPCSGEGMFRRGESVAKEWHENLNEMCSKRQLEILMQADCALKQNGYLIYSTCTYSKKENEDVVREFMSLKNYELINIDHNFDKGVDMPEVARLYPHKVRGEGQFVAVLKKKEENDLMPVGSIKLTNSKITNEFMGNNLYYDGEFYDIAGTSYFIKNKNLLKRNVNYVSLGVKLGKVENQRFEPHHNLFTAFGNDFKLKLCFEHTDKAVAKYLRGETLDVEMQDGYGVIMVNNCPLGGFKMSKGKFKNYYPKGLRNF